MIEVKKEGILLSKTGLEFENSGVLNPAVIQVGESVHVFYRAVRTGNHSTIGHCKLKGPLTVVKRWDKPIIVPELEFETQGIEDARIVKIDYLYYLSYTGYDSVNARGALATSKDLKKFTKHGIIVPPLSYSEFVFLIEKAVNVNKKYYQNHKFYYQKSDSSKKIMLWDKNIVFFPRRINGNLVFLHRIRPGIQIVSVKNINDLTKEYWEKYALNFNDHIVMDPHYKHESRYIGSGCPPIETKHGWLLIYHGVEKTEYGHIYSACAALLDLNDPSKEIARLPYALFSPEFEWELRGEVNNVVFPTGTSIFEDTLYIYYGAADERIAVASVNLSNLLTELLSYTFTNEK
jgi:beta-1,2-mannobiose phosphorylase / 1,2-beta-oligomannan phosphorylase